MSEWRVRIEGERREYDYDNAGVKKTKSMVGFVVMQGSLQGDGKNRVAQAHPHRHAGLAER